MMSAAEAGEGPPRDHTSAAKALFATASESDNDDDKQVSIGFDGDETTLTSTSSSSSSSSSLHIDMDATERHHASEEGMDCDQTVKAVDPEFSTVCRSKRKGVADAPDTAETPKRARKESGHPAEHKPAAAESLVVFIKGAGFSIRKMLTENPIAFRKLFVSEYGEADGAAQLCHEDCIRIKCRTAEQRNRLLTSHSFDGRSITVTGPRPRHTGSNNNKAARGAAAAAEERECRGVIYNVPDILTAEVIQRETGATSARRLNRGGGDNKRPTKSVLLTFSKELPKSVNIGFMSFRVTLYVPTVIRCGRCQRYGHTLERCTAKQRCPRCGSSHAFEDCPVRDQKDKAHCVHCGGNHSAAYKGCSKYKEVSKALVVMVKTGKSFRDALLNVKQAPAATPRDLMTVGQPARQETQQQAKNMQTDIGEPKAASTPIKSTRQPQRSLGDACQATSLIQSRRPHVRITVPPMRPTAAARVEPRASQQVSSKTTSSTEHAAPAAAAPARPDEQLDGKCVTSCIKLLLSSMIALLTCLAETASVSTKDKLAQQCAIIGAFAGQNFADLKN